MSNDLSAVFLHIPKNGGTSVKAALQTTLGFQPFEPNTATDSSTIILDHYHPGWLIEKGLLPKTILSTHWFFAVVRNPYDRARSLHAYYTSRGWITEGTSLEAFLRLVRSARPFPGGAAVARLSMAAPQTAWLDQRTLQRTRYFRLESLDGLQVELEKRFDTAVTFPRENVSVSKAPISEEARFLITQIYRRDFEAFGYSL